MVSIEVNYMYSSTQKTNATYICAYCGKKFNPKMYEIVYKHNGKCFCSYNCRAKYRKEVKK